MRVSSCRLRHRLISFVGFAVLALQLLPAEVFAQTDSQSETDLALSLARAISASDFVRAGEMLTPDAVVTFQNGDSVVGRDAIERYVKGLFAGKGALIQAYAGEPVVKSVTEVDAQSKVLAGTSTDTLTLSSGAPMVIETRWTATVVRRDGAWKIASLHLSTNMLDNPVIEKMKMTSYLLGAFGLVMGLTLGLGLMIILRRRAAPVEAQ